MHAGNHRRGHNWPDVVGRRDVQLGPCGRLGFGRDNEACWVTYGAIARQTSDARLNASAQPPTLRLGPRYSA